MRFKTGNSRQSYPPPTKSSPERILERQAISWTQLPAGHSWAWFSNNLIKNLNQCLFCISILILLFHLTLRPFLQFTEILCKLSVLQRDLRVWRWWSWGSETSLHPAEAHLNKSRLFHPTGLELEQAKKVKKVYKFRSLLRLHLLLKI
uniref:Uncharacterized protein n=1 Tax=Chromera velia TaxID=505693 RepID=D9IXF8_9ALVE|nr:hypothetical protein CHVEC_pgp012 [Chromera velia]ADJ66566.1 hypothetical protein [Chromera velia]